MLCFFGYLSSKIMMLIIKEYIVIFIFFFPCHSRICVLIFSEKLCSLFVSKSVFVSMLPNQYPNMDWGLLVNLNLVSYLVTFGTLDWGVKKFNSYWTYIHVYMLKFSIVVLTGLLDVLYTSAVGSKGTEFRVTLLIRIPQTLRFII